MMIRWLAIFISVFVLSFSVAAQNIYEARRDSARVPRQPYLRYFTKDKYNRRITFYVSETRSSQKLPLVVYVQGSGVTSNFIMYNGQVAPMNGHIYIYEALQDRARLLIVEKPGVNYLDNPANSQTNVEFNQQHSLERWSEAVETSIKAAIRSGLADSSRILVIGHSEGGLVACKVATDLGFLITHTANLAGGGDSQLFDILSLARKGNFFMNVSSDPEARVQYVKDEWKKILADSLNTDKFFFGFTYLRWYSFAKTSCAEQLDKYNGKILIAQGLKDQNVDPVSADQLYAHLLSKNKNVVFHRIENADHSFNDPHNPSVNGWSDEMKKILEWFLE